MTSTPTEPAPELVVDISRPSNSREWGFLFEARSHTPRHERRWYELDQVRIWNNGTVLVTGRRIIRSRGGLAFTSQGRYGFFVGPDLKNIRQVSLEEVGK